MKIELFVMSSHYNTSKQNTIGVIAFDKKYFSDYDIVYYFEELTSFYILLD